MRKSKVIIVAVILLILIITGYLERYGSERVAKGEKEETSELILSELHTVWPTEEWPTSTPEEQGMDSEKLVELFEYIEQNDPRQLHGLLIIRNGHIVAEKYTSPYNEKYPHNTYSVTKSLTSAIAGIAIDEGIINLNDRVLDYFPDMTFENMSEEKENMTIEQLLLMKTGIQWPEWDSEESSIQLFRVWDNSKSLLQYYLNQPIIKEQVGEWNYDTGAPYVLGAIIERASGMTLNEYGKEKIFDRIGMDSLEFYVTNEGIAHGGTYSQMTPRDMARFGYLYLHDGKWDGEQIVPKEWVKESLYPHTEFDVYDYDYGYYFYLNESENGRLFSARGAGGQWIIVVPELELIVIETGRSFERISLNEYILPAIKSESPLLANDQAYERLKELSEKQK
ncbi:serine hydrolase [Sporosarcina luteola]|uniref:Serine hydrolase n=1 Tax=Sporosarcina luteola TaxID=582850 RepID=A0A511Z9L4_9BACL|nr:serine hydrolase [Sporosarcina luteola]GEN84132.1 serine hydrolase [Sporosarcina luteola]